MYIYLCVCIYSMWVYIHRVRDIQDISTCVYIGYVIYKIYMYIHIYMYIYLCVLCIYGCVYIYVCIYTQGT